MVLECNAHFYVVNKYVLNFFEKFENKTDIIEAWKTKENETKLKFTLKKMTTKNPKRIKSRYIFFCDDERKTIIEENPGMHIKDVTCELGKRWQLFQADPDPAREARITEAFEKDKKRYDDAKADLVAKMPIKRSLPKSPYLKFCETERQSHPKITMKELGIRWNIIKNDAEQYEKYKALVA